MNIKHKFGRVAGITVAAVGIVGLSLPSGASASTAQPAATTAEAHVPGPGRVCTFQTYKTKNYLTAVGGGGRTIDVLHTDATLPRAWEKFKLILAREDLPRIRYGLRTSNGHYLTAVGGGGRITDVIHSDATKLRAWEKFSLIPVGNSGVSAIKTNSGHWLTAVGGGGRITDTIHSDATTVGSWEKFRIVCSK